MEGYPVSAVKPCCLFVLPLSDDALRLHNGPAKNSYMEQSFHGLNPVLNIPVHLGQVEAAKHNAGLTGSELERWVDELVGAHWSAVDMCSVGPSGCPVMQACSQTVWSALSPDPKAELGPIRADGHLSVATRPIVPEDNTDLSGSTADLQVPYQPQGSLVSGKQWIALAIRPKRSLPRRRSANGAAPPRNPWSRSATT
ncbi:UNVERIFIED_CONTAM: hypothetical protein FKN15_008618 [Acipenser sinensis]